VHVKRVVVGRMPSCGLQPRRQALEGQDHWHARERKQVDLWEDAWVGFCAKVEHPLRGELEMRCRMIQPRHLLR